MNMLHLGIFSMVGAKHKTDNGIYLYDGDKPAISLTEHGAATTLKKCGPRHLFFIIFFFLDHVSVAVICHAFVLTFYAINGVTVLMATSIHIIIVHVPPLTSRHTSL